MMVIFGIYDIGEYSSLISGCYNESLCKSCLAKKYPERWLELINRRTNKKEYYD